MISVLEKITRLNIKYKKNGGPTIDVCTGPSPDEVTALISYKQLQNKNSLYQKTMIS